MLCNRQDMDGLPDSTISTVLTFLDFKETHRCACINKEWKLHVRKKLERLREKAAQKRAQVCKYICTVQCRIVNTRSLHSFTKVENMKTSWVKMVKYPLS